MIEWCDECLLITGTVLSGKDLLGDLLLHAFARVASGSSLNLLHPFVDICCCSSRSYGEISCAVEFLLAVSDDGEQVVSFTDSIHVLDDGNRLLKSVSNNTYYLVFVGKTFIIQSRACATSIQK